MNILEVTKMSAQDRRDFLDTYSTEVKDQTYMRALSLEELNIKKDELAQAAMQKSVLLDELSEVKKSYKDRIEPLTKQFSVNLRTIKQKAVEVTGPAHKIPDYDNQCIHFVAQDGTIISTRPMLPEERQFTIQQQIAKAN